MSPKWLLPGILLLIGVINIGVSGQEEGFYYLISAHEATQETLFSFKVRVHYYGEYITNETETLSRLLTDLVAAELETITTAAEGFRMQGCVLQVATMALSTLFNVRDVYEEIQHKMVAFNQLVLETLLSENILTDLDGFSTTHQANLDELTDELNSDLLNNLVEVLRDLVSAQDYLGPRLAQCLSEVEK